MQLKNNCTRNSQNCTRLHLVQLLDCYSYNYSLIALKCVWLPMLKRKSTLLPVIITYGTMQIVHGEKVSGCNVLLKFVVKLLQLCHLCNTLLTIFTKLLLENFWGSYIANPQKPRMFSTMNNLHYRVCSYGLSVYAQL